MREIKILTGIRFYAALHVVIYHNLYLFGHISQQIPSFIQNFFSRGEAAVSFFFVLSGFILSYVYENKLETWNAKMKYLIARIAKIYPLYFLAFVLDIPRVLTFFYSTYDFNLATLKIMISSSAYLVFLQSWFYRLTTIWNAPAWSLSCEFFFYLCFIFLLKPMKNIQYKRTVISICYFIPLISYYLITLYHPNISNNPSFLTFWRSFPPLRLLEFIIGILSFQYIIQQKPDSFIYRNRSLLFWGSAFLSIFIASLDLPIPEKVFNGNLLLPFFLIMIMSSYWDKLAGDVLLKNPLVYLLGISSYALYIIHQPLKNYFLCFNQFNLLIGTLYFLSSILISIFLFYKFEIPMQKYLKTRLTKV